MYRETAEGKIYHEEACPPDGQKESASWKGSKYMTENLTDLQCFADTIEKEYGSRDAYRYLVDDRVGQQKLPGAGTGCEGHCLLAGEKRSLRQTHRHHRRHQLPLGHGFPGILCSDAVSEKNSVSVPSGEAPIYAKGVF